MDTQVNPKRSEKMKQDYQEYIRQGTRLHAAAGLPPFQPKSYQEWSDRYGGDYDWCEPG